MPSAYPCDISARELKFRIALIEASDYQNVRIERLNSKPETKIEESLITKKDFNRLIDSVKKVYVPIFKKQYLNFRIEAQWDDNQMNAFAGVRGYDRFILLSGGYARHKFMTEDAYLSVICHEVGHHLGGFPKKSTNPWSSSEGQADYFSTLKCMKEVLRGDENNQLISASLNLPDSVKKDCKFQFPIAEDYQICLRSAKAAEDYGRVVADIDSKGEDHNVSLLSPAAEVVTETNLKYPSAQCRVDTKYQGALCNVSTLSRMDDEDEAKGSCHFNNFNIIGNRPGCWFVHKK